MESGKRSKNFTEREKRLLIEVAKEFVDIIDNKKTDGSTVEAKKQAWMALANKYNAASETGLRTEKQLHALYDNIKKKARKNISADKSEIYKTGGGTFCPKTTAVDEKVVALLTPQLNPLKNQFDSSAPYYNLDTETQVQSEDAHPGTSQDLTETQSTSKHAGCLKRPVSPVGEDVENTPERKEICLTETMKKNINNLSAAMIKRKHHKQLNEDAITTRKLEILDIQLQHEKMKLEKTETLLNIEIELKSTLLENAKMDLKIKKKNFNL